MWKLTTCVLLLLLQPYVALAQFDLAQRIFESVHESLGSSLGKSSFPSVFRPFNPDLGQQIFKNVHDSLAGTADLGNRIAENVHQQLAPLQDLGLRIHEQVQHSLAPVHAMSIKNNMMRGAGGTTVAIYRGKRPRAFIIKDGVRNTCIGNVVGPNCYGYLQPFDIVTKEDFCYAPSYAFVNSRICLSPGHINVESINSRMRCESGDDLLSLSRRDYRELCGNFMPWHVIYRYYANPNDPNAIPIPNPNPHVTCRNNQPGVCEFQGDAGGSGTVISTSSALHSNFNNF